MHLAIDGAPLTEVYPVVPLAAGQALGIAISTYQSVAHLGLRADHATIPDLDRLTGHIHTALDELGAQPARRHHD